MRHVKTLGLLVGVMLALTVAAGAASATITSPAGTSYTGSIHATSTGVVLPGPGPVECEESTITASVTGGATNAPINSLTFGKCGNDTATAANNGSLAVASDGTVTLTGTEITVQVHRVVLGFPVTAHCIYKTNGHTGTLTEGTEPGLQIAPGGMLQISTDSSCSSNGPLWGGTYTVDSPHEVIVD